MRRRNSRIRTKLPTTEIEYQYAHGTNVYGSEIRDDGMGIFSANLSDSGKIRGHITTSPFYYESLVWDGKVGINGQTTTPLSLKIRQTDGKRIFYGSDATKKIHQVDLTTAWDSSTVDSGTWVQMANTGLSSPHGIEFSHDGMILFVAGSTMAWKKYVLTNPYDLSSFTVPTNIYTPTRYIDGFCFYKQGFSMIEVSRDNNNVIFKKLATAYEPTSVIETTTVVETVNCRDISATEDGSYVLYQRLASSRLVKNNIYL